MIPFIGTFALATGSFVAVLGYGSAYKFADDAVSGGGAGIFYNGSPRHKRYDCTMCHTHPPRDSGLQLSSEPAFLFEQGVYEPEAVYQIEVVLDESVFAPGGVEADTNTFSVEFVDAAFTPRGAFVDPDINSFEVYDSGAILLSLAEEHRTSWSFVWQAPSRGIGFVDMHIAAVDGNGSEDPRGDDVMTGAIRLAELGVAGPEREDDDVGLDEQDVAGCGVAPRPRRTNWALWLPWIVAFSRRRRRPGRRFAAAVLLMCLMTVVGCARVKPFQRRHLAEDVMDLDADPAEVALEQHFVQYREGSVGGRGGGGSGCGCN